MITCRGRMLMASIACFIILCISCKKQSSPEAIEKKRGDQFHSMLQQSKRFKLTAYYSDTPIDYIQTDTTVLMETDLWKYVRDYVKDAVYEYVSDAQLDIIQGATKFPSDLSDTISYPYSVYSAADHVDFNYYDFDYHPMTYQLGDFTDSFFTIYVKRGDAKLYSKFERVP